MQPVHTGLYQFHQALKLILQLQPSHQRLKPGGLAVVGHRRILCHRRRLGISAAPVNVRFLLCQKRQKHLHHLGLRVRLDNLAGPFVQFSRSGIPFSHDNRTDDEIIDPVTDISQCQR